MDEEIRRVARTVRSRGITDPVHALAVILGPHQVTDILDRPGADFLRVAVGGAVEPRFQPLDGERRVGGDPIGERQRARHQVVVRQDGSPLSTRRAEHR